MTCTGARDIPQSRTNQQKAQKLRELKWDHATYVLFHLRSSAGKVTSRGKFVPSGDVFALRTKMPRCRVPGATGLEKSFSRRDKNFAECHKAFLLYVCKRAV